MIALKNDAPAVPAPPPTLAVDAAELARLLCVCLRTVRTLDAAGKLPRGVKLAGRKLWGRAEVEAWFAAGAPDREKWEAMRKVRR